MIRCSTGSRWHRILSKWRIAVGGCTLLSNVAECRVLAQSGHSETVPWRAGSVWDLDFWIDPKQTYLLNADGMNNEVRTLRRETGEIVGAFGRNGRNAGEFHWVHNLAVDSKGNIFTTEVDTGKRAQKFRYVGPAVR